MIKKSKNTAILNDEDIEQKSVEIRVVPQVKSTQVLEVPNSDYIESGTIPPELKKYNLKSINIVRGRNSVIEIFKEV